MKFLWAAVTGVLLSVAVAAQNDSSPGSIEGTVRERESGAPIARAHVELRPVRPAGARNAAVDQFEATILGGQTAGGTQRVAVESRVVTTGADGRFAIRGVEPGEYRLYATRSTGYVPGEYGQRTASGEGASLTIAAGQSMSVSLLMTPTSSISGHVLDANGEPSGYAHVQALKAIYRNGDRTLTVMQLVQADERGAFRLFWLPPGEYFVCAKPLDQRRSSEMMHIPPPSRFGNYEQQMRPTVTAVNTSRMAADGTVIEEQYVPIYYGGTADERRASPIRLAAGQNVGGVDINVANSLVRTHRIRGTVINGTTGQPAAASLQVIPRDPPSILLIPTGNSNQDGTFDLWGALPGANYVVASGGGGTALRPVDITGNDVNGVTLTLLPGADLTGRILPADPADPNARVSGIGVSLRRSPPVNGLPDVATSRLAGVPRALGNGTFVVEARTGDAGQSRISRDDGTFVVAGVPPGDFAVDVALKDDAYVESISFGSRDVLNDGLHVDAAPPREELAIVVGMRGATIDGSVMNDRRDAGPGVTVVAIPDESRGRRDLYKAATTDSSGRFRLRGLAPGSYEIMAWTDVESGAWHDPEFLRRDEGRGRRVRVSEGAKMKIDVPMIPVR